MTSKTPNFDKALDAYFSKLELDEKGGQWRTCRFSGEKFYVRPEDVEFYKKIRVPLPTLRPNERWRLIFSFWNSYFLFNTKSALTGEKIISQYPPNTPFKIFEHQKWFGSTQWDPADYAREYKPEVSFFDQFKALQLEVPRPNLFVNSLSVNSDYTNDSVNLKNCYLVFNSSESENCHYSISPIRSRDCIDCFDVFDSSMCIECFESHELYNCRFVEFSKNCMESSFLYDCKNCTHCFGGVNLRNKKYVFFGEQLTKDEYERKVREINLGNRKVLVGYMDKFYELVKMAIHKPNHNEKSVNSTGDYIINSKDCYYGYFVEKSERTAYLIASQEVRDSYDSTAIGAELCYMASGATGCFGVLFSNMMGECRDSEYSDYCGNCHNVFGCVALLNKSFCVFNKQYSEDEYWKLVDEIKTNMLKSGEYGEFFPPHLSPFPYQASVMASYKGYDDFDNAKKYGYRFDEIPEEKLEINIKVLETDNVPDDINDTDDSILDELIFDKKNNKLFRYTNIELDFRRKFGLPLPREHFTSRLKKKREKFGSIDLKFYERTCPVCKSKFETAYSPEDPRIVYCESCYLKEIV